MGCALPPDGGMLEAVIAEHGGMISRGMALGIASSRLAQTASIESLLSKRLPEAEPKERVARLECSVYRVFNKAYVAGRSGRVSKRLMVLGSPPLCITASLWNKYSEMADLLPIERGDVLTMENIRLINGLYGNELSTTSSTSISRRQGPRTAVSNFSRLLPGLRDIDIVCSVAAVGKIKAASLNETGATQVSYATITDGKNEAGLLMRGSSCASASFLRPGLKLKVEFASVRGIEGDLEVIAGDYSRLLPKESKRKAKIFK